MALQLCGAQLRQYDISTVSGGFKTVTAPWPGMQVDPEFVVAYEQRTWRNDDMALLEWLRKTNEQGDIVGWLRQKHAELIFQAAWTARQLDSNADATVTEAAFRK
eukprot:2557462-Alexandrium_andersonii.AAC.1